MNSSLLSRPSDATNTRLPVPCTASILRMQPPLRQPCQPSFSTRPCDLPAQRDFAGASAAGRRAFAPVRAAAAAPAAAPPGHSLVDLPLENLLNTQGYIDPETPEGTEATVFAVFDKNKKLQYVGFSKDLRNSLRTLFGRRPDKVYYHKAAHLQKLDQQEMLAIRTAWFEEVGGPPIGNKLAMERAQWERPVDGGAISQRGKLEAAKAQLVMQLTLMRARGAVEEFDANPELLELGQVDFLPSKAMDREDMERLKERAEAIVKATRIVSAVIDGQLRDFKLFFQNSYKTNGGWMFDVVVTFEERETKHRVICGEEFYEPLGIEPETTIERAFSFLLAKKVPRHTEGLMLSSEFPINYFAISEVEQEFPDFQDMFPEGSLPGDGSFWRFNRIHDYSTGGNEEPGFNTITDFGPSKTTWIDS